MSKIQVEVSFTDELESIRVDGKEMEIPKAIKTKPVGEWFEPTVGRVRWGGLGAEIKEMDFSNEKNAVYSFLFIGPEDKKQEFMACVERFCLGEEAQQGTKKENEQDYLHNAQNYQQAGNAEMAFQQYMVAARDYGRPEAQFEVAQCYQNGTGVEKSEENAVVWYKKAAEQCDANTYRALMVGEGSSVESGAVNVWQNNEAEVAQLREYLKRFMHPVFARPLWEGAPDSLLYTPATLVSGRELPMHLGLPTRSVHGLPVIEHAEFGRNVPDAAIEKADKIDLGKIYHMGQPESADLILSRQAMAAHTFITGSTGTGKSNAVYHLLDELTKDGNTTFLVVEPAKGEYKTVFGNGKAAVYGTNPRETPLLRLNPFAFPAEIHVLEHIDRLVEIFSACWPMYAAMPAVLKDAIERSYQNAGWDLRESESERGVFPTFFDLLRVLPTVIEESHYSNDTQSDYVGALCTRVKSLTNGIYGSVFCAEDVLSDAELFDENVIVDLSRASAMETKSLLMGILVMKLQEYRMCSGVMNGKLRHVTVLEEAHNLLRKTSSEQSQESANVQGKSVEMLANAIAEMRTYGEGFIVADQAPGLLDVSVIRNTNTKIILRLPDEEDRKLVGKSAGLKEAQIDELSKLPLGVAAVYQNERPEAVLCKVKAYPVPEGAVYHKPVKTEEEINTEFIFGQLAQEAPAKCLNDSEMEQLKRWLKRHEIWIEPEERRYIEQVFRGELKDRDKTQKMVFDFFGGMETLIQYCYEAEKTLTPRRELVNQLQGRYALQTSTAEWALNCLMTEGLQRNPDRDAAKELRKNFLEQGGKVM